MLTEDKKRELDIAYNRQLLGQATDADKRNLEYATSKGLWSPTTQPSFVRYGPDIYTAPTTSTPSRYIAGPEWESTYSGRAQDVTGQPGMGGYYSPGMGPPGGGTAGTGGTGTGVGGAGSMDFNSAIVSLLRSAQQGGLDEDLLNQRNALVTARFRARTDMTPEMLRNLTPAQQANLRSANVSGLEDQLGGVTAALSAREGERSELRNVMENAQNRLFTAQQNELAYQRSLTKPIEVGGNILQYNPQTKKYDTIYSPPKGTNAATAIVKSGSTSYLISYDASTGEILNRQVIAGGGGGGGGGGGAEEPEESEVVIDAIRQNLEANYQGSDSYINTEAYRDAYNEFATRFPDQASKFTTYLPPETYLNPNDPTALPLFGVKPPSENYGY